MIFGAIRRRHAHPWRIAVCLLAMIAMIIVPIHSAFACVCIDAAPVASTTKRFSGVAEVIAEHGCCRNDKCKKQPTTPETSTLDCDRYQEATIAPWNCNCSTTKTHGSIAAVVEDRLLRPDTSDANRALVPAHWPGIYAHAPPTIASSVARLYAAPSAASLHSLHLLNHVIIR